MSKKEKRTNAIGLDSENTKELAQKLNTLLANYQVFYQNARGFHWNIKGEKFFELHTKFEEIYTDSLLKIDEIAERITTLGYTPLHSFSDYVKNSSIKEVTQVSDGIRSIEEILKGFKILLEKERVILNIAAEAEDEGTSALISDYITYQEKMVWMYSAYLAV